jgi:hypothetical protein
MVFVTVQLEKCGTGFVSARRIVLLYVVCDSRVCESYGYNTTIGTVYNGTLIHFWGLLAQVEQVFVFFIGPGSRRFAGTEVMHLKLKLYSR